jgi:hypothetical protein
MDRCAHVCGCVCVCACVRACVRVHVHAAACVHRAVAQSCGGGGGDGGGCVASTRHTALVTSLHDPINVAQKQQVHGELRCSDG